VRNKKNASSKHARRGPESSHQKLAENFLARLDRTGGGMAARNAESETKTLLNSGIYSIVGECQPERSRYAFKVLGPPVPLRIAVIAGEVIHHLRTCYDQVVWALANKNGLPDTERITFPVCLPKSTKQP
jgi:hypothetical protein